MPAPAGGGVPFYLADLATLSVLLGGGTQAGGLGTLASTTAAADQVVATYTVTSGKTLYLAYLNVQTRLTTFAATATLFGAFSLEIGAGSKRITHELQGAGYDRFQIAALCEPFAIVAGTVVRIVCTPSAVTPMTWSASFGGVER